jgi:16S rRNA (adenine1518-N6/adenine1519-N6)-dimethyltransferase
VGCLISGVPGTPLIKRSAIIIYISDISGYGIFDAHYPQTAKLNYCIIKLARKRGKYMTDRSSPTGVKEIMRRYDLRAKKSWGQNFLIDRNVLARIADSCTITSDQYLVEIGPGLGGLTQELALRCRGVLAIEKDTGMESTLRDLVSEYANVSLLFKDVLKVDIETALMQAFDLQEIPNYQVCANIPYSITTPILFQLLEKCPHMQAATLMMQKEVGERLLAQPGGKEYGRLTITAAYYADLQPVFNVSHHCFYPQPEVDSAVLRIIPQRPRRVLLHREDIFKNFLRYAFQKRRKTLLNISSGFFKLEKIDAESQLKKLGLAANLRPENLSIDDFVRLVNALAT